jgi:hypothetical protein
MCKMGWYVCCCVGDWVMPSNELHHEHKASCLWYANGKSRLARLSVLEHEVYY